MYITLIENTIRELRGEREPEVEIRPEIHLGLSAFIPEDYMPDMHRRLVSYKRLSMSSTEEDLSELRSELMDCYGFVPPKVDRLFEVIRIRNLAKRAMAERIDYDGKNLSVSFARNSTMDPEKIMKIVKRQVKGTRFTPDFKLCVPIRDLANEEILQETKGLLKELLN
jgi:transcription-repair coupling factor (superfamily II helicase)